MERRTFGNTDLLVSTIGLGCYGMSGVYGPADDVEAIATIDRERRRGSDALAKLLPPSEQLAYVNPGRPRHLGSDCARLHRRRNNPLLLRPRPPPAMLHRLHP